MGTGSEGTLRGVRSETVVRPGRILALVCAAAFMGVLDLAIVNVALPSIQRDLAVGQGSLQWVVTAYGLTFGGFLLLGGRLADRLGPRRVFVTGLTVFALASLACGLASTLTWLVAARGLQGLGAALTAPSGRELKPEFVAFDADSVESLQAEAYRID